MFLATFVVLFVGANGRDLIEPRFRVLTPDELMVEVPHYEGTDLVTFRIGVKRKDSKIEDLELGESVMNNNRIFIYNERLNLKRDDVVNYLLAFKDKEGYQAQTGKYVFDGVYLKKSFGTRSYRFERTVVSSTEKSEYNMDESEDAEPIEPRFGGPHHHHPRGGFNPFRPPSHGGGPPQFFPGYRPRGYPEFPFHGNNPDFGGDCGDHRHDMCHRPTDNERWQKTTARPSATDFDEDYYCRLCQQMKMSTSTTKPLTSTEYPDIDIRFSDD